MTTTIAGIEVIDTFLANWKVQATEFYTNLRQQAFAKRKERYEITTANLAKIEMGGFSNKPKYSPEKAEEIVSKIANGEMAGYMIDNLNSQLTWQLYKNWVEVIGKTAVAIAEDHNAEELSKLLDKEVERKKKALIATVEKKAGKIVDASGLSIGDNADINGTVVGEVKTVKVSTITAGGYNIQCLHYRVLVK